jgi:hypothetical protein
MSIIFEVLKTAGQKSYLYSNPLKKKKKYFVGYGLGRGISA